MLISVLLPILFYVQLHFKAMGALEKLWFACLTLGSVAFTIVITIVDVQEFIASLAAAALGETPPE